MPRPAPVLSLTPSSAPAHPARKLVETVVLMAIRDRASAVRFEPTPASYQLSMIVNENRYELWPPRLFLAGRIARIFRVLAEMDINQPNADQTGALHVMIGAGRAEIHVAVGPSQYGPVVQLEIQANTIAPGDAEAVLRGYGMMGEDASIEFMDESAPEFP